MGRRARAGEQRAGIRPHGVTRTGTRIGRATVGSGTEAGRAKHIVTHILRRFTVKPLLFCNSPYKQIWFRKLENLVNMVFLVEVNNKYRTNLNELCIKNTTPHVGTLGQNFSSQVKSHT